MTSDPSDGDLARLARDGDRAAFRLLRTGAHPLLELLVGLVVLTAVGLIPILGGIVDVAAVVFGLGALALTLFRSWRGPAEKKSPDESVVRYQRRL